MDIVRPPDSLGDELERVMDFGVSAKAAAAVPGKAHAAGQAGRLAKACNASHPKVHNTL
jgi:hypothetical protein